MYEGEVIKYEPSEPKYLIYERDRQVRVCAYCRVSSEKGEQASSLESQLRFFEGYFQRHPSFVNIGIFSDRGISGTSLSRRDGFLKMLSLARGGEVELILTKEVSRFSRNLLDTLKIVDELRRIGVYVYFISDDINTQDLQHCGDLANIANAAESESRRTSKRVRWGQKEQMKRGVVFGRSRMLGYKIVREGERQVFEIVESEAQIVKKIFHLFCRGVPRSEIARILTKDGYFYYKSGWSVTNITRILTNEKYAGDLTLGKSYTPDMLTHKKKYNRGQSFMVTHKDHHADAAIVERELWDKTQALLGRGQAEPFAPTPLPSELHTRRFCFSGRIFCGECGAKYISYTKKQKTGVYHAWVCHSKHAGNRCKAQNLNDRVIKAALKYIVLKLISESEDRIITAVCERVGRMQSEYAKSESTEKLRREIEGVKSKTIALTDKYISGEIDGDSYRILKERYASVKATAEERLITLSKPENSLLLDFRERVGQILTLEDEGVCEQLFGRILKKAVVHRDNKLELYFSFCRSAVYLKYTTKGKGKSYRPEFEMIDPLDFSSHVIDKRGSG